MPDDKGRGEREICERLVHLRDTMRNGKPQAYHRDHLDTLADAVNALQALEQQLNEARGERDEARSRREWTEQWYAERFERLRDLAKEKGIWSEAAAILANGTVSPMEPPHYGQQLNTTRHRAEAAERREEGLRKALARLVTDAINAHPHTATSHQPGLAKGIQEARVALFDFQEGGEPRARGIGVSEGGAPPSQAGIPDAPLADSDPQEEGG